MRILLDTHIAIWAAIGSPSLPAQAVTMIDDLENEVWVSSVALWEIAIKHAKGKFPHDASIMSVAFLNAGLKSLPVEEQHARMLDTIPLYEDHQDPFDRMMVAQAKAEGMLLLTCDGKMHHYAPIAHVL